MLISPFNYKFQKVFLWLNVLSFEPRFPDDLYYRLWQPFTDKNEVVLTQTSVNSLDFWNKPPVKAFSKAIAASVGKKLEIQWPSGSLQSTRYYVSLYFQDNRAASANSWRVFSVAINGNIFYNNLNVSTGGVTIYSAEWPLSGPTTITLTPDAKSSAGPLINAGEVYQILPFGRRTLAKDGSFFSLLLVVEYGYKDFIFQKNSSKMVRVS